MSDNQKHEKIQEKIRKSLLQKFAIFAVIVAAISVLWFILFFQPIRQKTTTYSHGVKEWTGKIKLATVSQKSLTQLQTNVDSLENEIKRIERRIYYLDDMSLIAEHLIRYAANHHLKVQSMTPNYDILFPVNQVNEQGKPLVKLPLEIKMTGRYISVGKFIADVDQLPFIFSPVETSLEADINYYPRLRIMVKGFLFLLKEEKISQTNYSKGDK